MTIEIFPEPPRFPPMQWLCEFAAKLIADEPGLTFREALRTAMLAHRGTWLLEPTEAAELWMAAIRAENPVRRLPRGLLG